MAYMFLPLRRYAQFNGRSRRQEYWLFALLLIILHAFATLIDRHFGYGSSYVFHQGAHWSAGYQDDGPAQIVLLAITIVPSLAVLVRRLHDTDRSAWRLLWLLLPLFGWIVVLVFLCERGTTASNRYGFDPVGEAEHA